MIINIKHLNKKVELTAEWQHIYDDLYAKDDGEGNIIVGERKPETKSYVIDFDLLEELLEVEGKIKYIKLREDYRDFIVVTTTDQEIIDEIERREYD